MDEKTQETKVDEEIAFIAYQEDISRAKGAKRNRILLICLSTALYLLGIGLFASIVNTLYNINHIAGLIVGGALLFLYTICYIILLVFIFSKQSFDIEYKRREKGVLSQRKNNAIRFSMARNIKEQSEVIDYLSKQGKKEYQSKTENEKTDAFLTILTLSQKYKNTLPSFESQDSISLAKSLNVSLRKDGIIYKKAKSLILKRAITTGMLTAVSQNAFLDVSIVAVKNIQLVKDLIFLYGFRPTDSEMNRILFQVIRNVCIAIGLNTMPKNTSVLSKVLNKDSNNFFIQLFGQVLDMGAQFLGNGIMTYLVGRYTVKVLLKEYHLQDLMREKSLSDFEMEFSKESITYIEAEIKEGVKEIKDNKKEEVLLLTKEKKRENFFQRIFSKKEK